jgi:phage shock protein PspC (stress-responsive transcriptional regulator)
MIRDASRLLFVWFAALASALVAMTVLYIIAMLVFAWMLGGLGPDD